MPSKSDSILKGNTVPILVMNTITCKRLEISKYKFDILFPTFKRERKREEERGREREKEREGERGREREKERVRERGKEREEDREGERGG
jgi:hypothetical protein